MSVIPIKLKTILDDKGTKELKASLAKLGKDPIDLKFSIDNKGLKSLSDDLESLDPSKLEDFGDALEGIGDGLDEDKLKKGGDALRGLSDDLDPAKLKEFEDTLSSLGDGLDPKKLKDLEKSMQGLGGIDDSNLNKYNKSLKDLQKGLTPKRLRQFNKDLKSLNNEFDKGAKVDKFNASIGKFAGGLAIGALVKEAAQFTAEAINMASTAKAVESTFLNLSQTSEIAAENMAAMGRATKDLVSDTEQQKIANQLLGIGIVETSEQLEKTVNISRRLGATFKGLGAADAAEEFALLISNMSIARLDSFGINAGKVKDRMAELTSGTNALSKEQAFFEATMAEAEKTLSSIGPEVVTTAQKMEQLDAELANSKEAFGSLFTGIVEGSGALDLVIDFASEMTDFFRAMREGIETTSIMAESVNDVGFAFNFSTENLFKLVDGLNNLFPIAAATGVAMDNFMIAAGIKEGEVDLTGAGFAIYEKMAEGLGDVRDALVGTVTNADELTEAMVRNREEREIVVPPQLDTGPGAEVEEEEDNSERLAELEEIQRDFAGSLIDINEGATQDIDDTWVEFFDGQKDLFKTSREAIKGLEDKFNKDTERSNTQHQIKLRRLGEDASKNVKKKQADFKSKDKAEQKRSNVDALADQRLFDFELQNLAAEGQGNQIRELQARRAIEEQIASEKAEVEGQIEDDARDKELEGIQETGDLRRERLIEDHELEQQFRAEDLQEQVQAEADNFDERLLELNQFRVDKLAEIEASKTEAVAKLGEEFVAMGDLTEEELAALGPIAGRFGEDAGVAFAEGIAEGFERENVIDELLGKVSTEVEELIELAAEAEEAIASTSGAIIGQRGGGGSTITSGAAIGQRGGGLSGDDGFIQGRGRLGFATGGTTPGGPVNVGEFGPETISAPRGSLVTAHNNINVSGFGAEEMAQMLAKMVGPMMEQQFQMFIDEHLAPWAN